MNFSLDLNVLTFIKKISLLILLYGMNTKALWGQADTTPIRTYAIVGKMPAFPGGADSLQLFLNQNLKYPPAAKASKTEGSVVVQFIVREDGKLINPFIMRGLDPDCDREALRLIKIMPDWEPAIQRGNLARVQYSLSIRFELPK